MDENNRNLSTDFTLTGLFTHSKASGFLFGAICAVFFMAMTANGVTIFLVHADPHLHTPMYFLLSHLSFIDVMYSSTIVPKMLADYFVGKGTISFVACTAQYFLYMGFVGAEFFLLGLMAYDRYVAICHPLRYPVLMSRRVCWMILASSWLGGALDSFLLTLITMSLPFCTSHEINHFFCEAPTMLRLACGDKAAYETVMYVCCVMMLLIPFSVVMASYTRILITVQGIKSAEGRKKAFATCSSHVIVVTLFYGAALYTYMLPRSYHTPIKDKVFSAFYTILTPLLNPLIYSLRNRDVMGAWRRVMARCRGACDRVFYYSLPVTGNVIASRCQAQPPEDEKLRVTHSAAPAAESAQVSVSEPAGKFSRPQDLVPPWA
ncbi:olfactory receptor 2T6-like [Eulemur rufifrons]|uniref:olfactory receptor 2T6-like n=1 Tax=Eulemur rufifrons TaxID=859984 RepID=UPI003741F3B6